MICGIIIVFRKCKKLSFKGWVKIKVIAGNIRGLKLDSDKNEKLRPTKDRVKESLFNILNFDILGKSFLDLFGGTGQIGIEAFSRGAENVVIIEHSKENAKLIKKNIAKIKQSHNIKFFQTDAINYIQNCKNKFDIIYIDPPYQKIDILEKSLIFSEKIINKNGFIITETLSSYVSTEKINNITLQKRYIYGNISLNLYKNIQQ